MEKIGIIGGTFDPIHIGHLVLAEQIRTKFNLEKIIFIPAGTPPHKLNMNITSSKDRYNMTLIATINNPNFEVSSIEIDQADISYTINTIKKMKEIYKDSELYFIIGADVLYELDTWKEFENLFKLCKFIAATRPGTDEEKLLEKKEFLEQTYGAKILLTKVLALDISSTDIRNRIREGESIKYIVPEPVEKYIIKNKLYK